MDKQRFIKALRITAEVLQPLTKSLKSGSFEWNGREYAEVISSKEAEKEPNPYALAWAATLTTIAELIEAQESPLSHAQTTYLRSVLFGGMGSLTDLKFDPKGVGDVANVINARLEIQTNDLFNCLAPNDKKS